MFVGILKLMCRIEDLLTRAANHLNNSFYFKYCKLKIAETNKAVKHVWIFGVFGIISS